MDINIIILRQFDAEINYKILLLFGLYESFGR